ACHYPMIIIPEMFKNVEVTFDRMIKMMVSSIVKRAIYGMSYGAIMISEGVFHFMSDKEIINSGIKLSFDEHGHPELGKVSKAHIFNVLLSERLDELGIKIKCRPVEIGYEVRCCAPTAFDLKYCTLLGFGVKKLFDEGKSGCIVVCHNDGRVLPLYLEDVEDPATGKIKPRLVDTEAQDFKMFLENLHYINEDDYQKASKYLKNPQLYDLKNILGW
ncbi:MAG TPA: 6-phosphofructokinase, partial [bacterium]|nr:6-phosphofructokinase [bacterium]